MIKSDRTQLGTLLVVALLLVAACGNQGGASATVAGATPTDAGADLSGDIRIDGSSTVFPVTEAIAEEFQAQYPNVRVTVAFSGTSGGFEKFCRGETEANDASRPIKEEEVAACADNGIEGVELPVAFDGLSLVVHPGNDFVECLTVAELNAIWDEGSTINNWSQVRDGFPDQPITLFGAGADSGTFDYFTEEINGETDRSRSDYTQSEDDNQLVQGVSGDANALGYFGYAYYVENQDRLKLVAVDDEEGDEGCVLPSEETISNGTYAPLSRPIFIYPAKQALERPEVAEFFRFYLANVDSVLGTEEGQVGYIALTEDLSQTAQSNLDQALP